MPALDSGNTAWMLTSTALVLFMTIPGLALFYGGLVRTKNVLSVLMQCFAITSLVTVLWVAVGYSLVFTPNPSPGLNAFIGGLDKALLIGVHRGALVGTIPESVFAMFQLTFAIITPALVIGAFAERVGFGAMLLFMALWSLVVYVPVAHWIWGGGWLQQMGTLDFAGGIVVHVSAGVAGLVTALYVGRRRGYPATPMPPHSLTLSVVGAGMLWMGWFGFNAGSALMANGTAGMAVAVTQISAATGAMVWLFIEWRRHGRPSVLGIITGAVAGLATITPASGYAGPGGALVIGAVAGAICFVGATTLKRRAGYDDSLDAFGVHGVGGFVGSVLTGVFASAAAGGSETFAMGRQVAVQLLACCTTAGWSAVMTWLALKVADVSLGARVDEEQEVAGLDLTDHEERGYDY
ncbi:MAG TPA: ammonium transporter [Anaeromyxobacteraceae bacterium]|nr:ammonium transporter [Anaeromyxobacteraceae bacterium]